MKKSAQNTKKKKDKGNYLDASKITICGYGNSTRISINKIRLPNNVHIILNDKLNSLFEMRRFGKAEETLDAQTWQHLSKALKHWNDMFKESFIQVFYKHEFVGKICLEVEVKKETPTQDLP